MPDLNNVTLWLNQPTIVKLKDQVNSSRYSENVEVKQGCS